MSTNFPGALDALTNPLGSDSLAAVSHAAQHTNANDAIEALEARVGITGSADTSSITYRLSADGEGAALAALTTKATPVDADLVALSDSEAGGVLKKLSWSSIKTALQSVFATLAGIAGGQTLNGGTAASETLTLRSTAHATKGKILFGSSSAFDESTSAWGFGTTSPSAKVHVVNTAEQQRLGYDVATYLSMTVSNVGAVTYSATGGQYIFKGANSTATLGSDLVTNGAFTSDLSGWTDSGASWSWSAGTALHTPGSASTLSQNITVATGNTYYIELTITGRTAGTISVSVGSVSMVESGSTTALSGNWTYKKTLVAAATGAVALTLTPTSTFDGAIDTISVKNVTLGSAKAVNVIQNSDGTTGFEIRSGGIGLANAIAGGGAGRSIISSYGCAAFGHYTLQALTTGINNSGFGYYALGSCTVASNNSAFGYNASYNLTSGANNSGFGNRSLYNNTTGGNNCALGYSALESNTAGAHNTGVGMAALFSQTTGSNNTTIGAYSGRYITDGSTGNAACDNSTFIGYSTKAQASGQTNQTVIGYNAVGLGSNTTVIGSSATVTFKAFGTPILTPAASSVPTVNGELTVEATSNTSLTFRLKGTDGTVRSASLTLA